MLSKNKLERMKKELSYNENEKKSLDLKGFVCDINSLEINSST
jgi:hypothetical protein